MSCDCMSSIDMRPSKFSKIILDLYLQGQMCKMLFICWYLFKKAEPGSIIFVQYVCMLARDILLNFGQIDDVLDSHFQSQTFGILYVRCICNLPLECRFEKYPQYLQSRLDDVNHWLAAHVSFDCRWRSCSSQHNNYSWLRGM